MADDPCYPTSLGRPNSCWGEVPGRLRRVVPFVLGVVVVFPSVLTWAYFVALADGNSAVQQLVYQVGKVIQFGFPALWVALVLKERVWPRRPRRGLLLGALCGGLIVAAIFALYYLWLSPQGFFCQPAQEVRQKVRELGFNSHWKFVALSVFYAFCHSYLEEYYWRWFVFRLARRRWSHGAAMWLSSLGFMAHHVIVLGTYFGWTSSVTYIFSGAVAVGGAVWAWIYARTRSLAGAWLSHLMVDAAIFAIGYDLVSSSFG